MMWVGSGLGLGLDPRRRFVVESSSGLRWGLRVRTKVTAGARASYRQPIAIRTKSQLDMAMGPGLGGPRPWLG